MVCPVMKEAASRAGRNVTVAVAGCVAQAEGQEIVRRAPVVDLVACVGRRASLTVGGCRSGDPEYPV